jgi:hemolysin III
VRRKFREPISGLTHLIGAILSAAALVGALYAAAGRAGRWRIVSLVIFGLSLILLYSSSAIYHLIKAGPVIIKNLRRLDHAMVYVLIAGTYTPFCLGPLWGRLGFWALAAIWSAALLGACFSILWIGAPRWLATSLYLVMGWAIIALAGPLWQALAPGPLIWLLIGGLLYSLGAVIYVLKRPNPWPGIFGFHEIWHLFVLAGSISHFVSVIQI